MAKNCRNLPRFELKILCESVFHEPHVFSVRWKYGRWDREWSISAKQRNEHSSSDVRPLWLCAINKAHLDKLITHELSPDHKVDIIMLLYCFFFDFPSVGRRQFLLHKLWIRASPKLASKTVLWCMSRNELADFPRRLEIPRTLPIKRQSRETRSECWFGFKVIGSLSFH